MEDGDRPENRTVVALWRASGFVQADMPAASAACPGCCATIDEVVRLPDAQGQVRAYLSCSACGLMAVPWAALERWRIDLPRLLGAIATGLGLRGRPVELVPDRLWCIGRTGPSPREVCFARCLYGAAGEQALVRLRRKPNAIVLAPTAATHVPAEANLPEIWSLSEILSWDGQQFIINLDHWTRRAGVLPGVTRTKAQRPVKRGSRLAVISGLEAELQDHLIAARDHAYHTRATTGTPLLLPRPTQKELAGRVGHRLRRKVSRSAVSRSFQDKAAGKLRSWWAIAEDVYLVMDWNATGGNP